jgi:hypothetical protein
MLVAHGEPDGAVGDQHHHGRDEHEQRRVEVELALGPAGRPVEQGRRLARIEVAAVVRGGLAPVIACAAQYSDLITK